MNRVRYTLRRLLLLLLLTAALSWTVLLLVSVPTASALVRKPGNPSTDPTGLVSMSPSRLEQDVAAGVTVVVPYKIKNESDQLVDITLTPSDFGPSTDPRTIGVQIEDAEFGAGDWITPEVRDLRLAPFETVEFNVTIDPPAEAPVGTNLASLSMRAAQATGGIGTDDQAGGPVALDLVGQIFLTVAGPVEHDLRIEDVRTRDAYLLGSTRFVVWDIEFANRGTVNEHVAGTLVARSLFGNSAHRAKISDLVVLRGDTRTARVVWRDPPWVGAFTPEVSVRADDAKRRSATGDRLIVLPWWVPVLILLAIVLPALLVWWRRRSDWRDYLDDDGVAEDLDPDEQDLLLDREW